MEKLLGDVLTQGLTPGLAMGLLQLLIILFVSTSVKNWIAGIVGNRLAYRRLKSNKYLKAGAWVEYPTTIGSIITKVDRITPSKVVLRSEKGRTWIHVPIREFADNALIPVDTYPHK